ncbi:putative G-protein coupled receptor 160 [Discoglossus pictus]
MQFSDEALDLDTMEITDRQLPHVEIQFLQSSYALILILTGKILLNTFTFWARPKNVGVSFLGFFCVSLALVDFALLIALSAIYYFQDVVILGIRFTNYHICLFTQIISYTYGILHYPVFLTAGLDYYLTIVKSVSPQRICLYMLYTIAILLLWIIAFYYVLSSPAPSLELYKCTFYVSAQSYYLSAVITFIIFIVFMCCFSEVVAFIRSVKIISHTNTTVMLFSYGNEWPIQGKKRFLATLIISFLGTWSPFVVLQLIIFFLCANVPGYMDMNVPWLYFLNSFLVGTAYFLKYPNIQLREKCFSTDPFICWKYSLMPFLYNEHTKEGIFLNEPSDTVIII